MTRRDATRHDTTRHDTTRHDTTRQELGGAELGLDDLVGRKAFLTYFALHSAEEGPLKLMWASLKAVSKYLSMYIRE